MATTTNLSTLKINKLTQAQYDAAVANGTIDENALYLTPDEEIDLSLYMTKNNPTGTGSLSMNRKSGTTVGAYSATLGVSNEASGYSSIASGDSAIASGDYSHATGYNTTASGNFSHATGYNTTASGNFSHAEGSHTIASGSTSHAEGTHTTASGSVAHAEGYYTNAEGSYSHASGRETTAAGECSHTEGYWTRADGYAAHAEGYNAYADGYAAHAEGYKTTASGDYSHAEGYEAYSAIGQHVQGHYNKSNVSNQGSTSGTTGSAFIIGNGTSSATANAFRVMYNGKPYALSTMNTSGADYAEFFEWQDSNPNDEDRRGYFVTLDGEKIKIAEPNDYILGIISALPAVIGNGDEDWRGRYILDEFGAFIVEEFEYEEEIFDKEIGEMKTVTKTSTKYKENPDYDPTLPYIQREDRPEWDAVGMMGVLSVRDDGTCQVNSYCKVADGGIATASESGYRVIKRVNENIVKVVFR